jgi:hypothetical protein
MGWHWGKNVDISQYFHAVYHAYLSRTFAASLTHNFPMSCYRFVTYSPWYESSKAWQQWGKSMGKMWKTTPNVVVLVPRMALKPLQMSVPMRSPTPQTSLIMCIFVRLVVNILWFSVQSHSGWIHWNDCWWGT